MNPSSLGSNQSQQDLLLVKDNLAAYFREEIITGRLATGEKIVEIKWSKVFKTPPMVHADGKALAFTRHRTG
jgi:DNA-binding GntR family transcriptional regulator